MANLSMDLMADWIKFFQNRINIERQRKRLSAPLHAELNDSITVVISELCRRFQLPLEVYPTALEFYEDLLFLEEEEQRSGKLPGDHYFNPAPKQDQLENRMQREMLACIQLASKTVCNRRVLTTRMLNSLFPGISKKSALKTECEVFLRLNPRLGRPTLLSSLELLLLALENKKIIMSSAEFFGVTQPLLHFYTFHRWDLIKNFVKSGPSKAVSLHEAIQGLFSDHFLISSSLIVAMTVLLNGDATETMKALESAAHINVENVHTFAEILLRAISNLEHTK